VALTLEAKSPFREGGFLLFGCLSGWSGGHFASFGIKDLAGRRFIVG
jgi:hypothetical protein